MANKPLIDYCIIICTYNRSESLKKLILDLSNQSVTADRIIIVDGNPKSGEIYTLLESFLSIRFIYVPSNHANISYQRFLGWVEAKSNQYRYMIYLDDDLEIPQQNSIEKLISPFEKKQEIVGVTGTIIFGKDNQYDCKPSSPAKNTGKLLPKIGGARKIKPGGLSSTGVRVFPEVFSEDGYGEVKWAHGAVMAFKVEALDRHNFPEDSFALHEAGYGLGEDTIISHTASFRGKMLFARDAKFHHPKIGGSMTKPKKPYHFGMAVSYSRRLLNDHYRETKPKFGDRIELIMNYVSSGLIYWWRALTSQERDNYLFALGYSFGAIRGIIQKPTSKRLTPFIDWKAETEIVLREIRTLG